MKYLVQVYKVDKKGRESLDVSRVFEDKKEAKEACKNWNKTDKDGNTYHAEIKNI